MPRTTSDILRHADDLAARFEEYTPRPGDGRAVAPLSRLRASVLAKADAERDLRDAVALARREGVAWSAIGAVLGTSGEAARQRYRDAA